MQKIFILLFSLNFIFILSQKINFKSNIQIVYNLNFKSSLDQINTDSDIVCLYLGDKQSIFQNENKSKIDSIISKQKIVQLPLGPIFKVNHVVFKDYNSSKATFSELIDKVNLGYSESIPLMDWKLIDKTKKILGYNCKKAETSFRGRNYIAWYTPEIAISDGPYKFSGLPGLILEVFDDKKDFHYSLLQIIKKNKEIVYDGDIKYIDRKKFLGTKINNLIKNSKKNLVINPIEKY